MEPTANDQSKRAALGASSQLRKLRWRRRVRVVAMDLGFVLLIAGALEGLACSVQRIPGQEFQTSATLHHLWAPESTTHYDEWASHNPAFPDGYSKSANAQALLERDFVQAPGPGEFRILCLGDSFTAGYCAPEDTLSSGLQSGLQESGAHHEGSVRVINAGTPGHSPILHFLRLKEQLLDLRPQLVLLSVDLTDDFDDWCYGLDAEFDDAGLPRSVKFVDPVHAPYFDSQEGVRSPTPVTRFQLWLYRHSHAYNWLLGRFSPSAFAAQIIDNTPDSELYQRWSWCKQAWDERTSGQVERTLSYLRASANLCSARGVQLVLTCVPHYQQFSGSAQGSLPAAWSLKPQDAIRELAEELKVPYCDSWSGLRPTIEGTAQDAFYYYGDMHFNPRGNRAWAAVLLEFLRRSDLALLPQPYLAPEPR